MFNPENDWGEVVTPSQGLSENLFGKIEVISGKNKVKSANRSQNGENHSMTREQWKRKQKNRRRAKKRTGGDLNVQIKDPDSNSDTSPEMPNPKKNKCSEPEIVALKPKEKIVSSEKEVPPLPKEDLPTLKEDKKSSFSLKEKLLNKLTSSRFRFINEQMYTCNSKEVTSLFEKDKDAFNIYHQGFINQVAKWPLKPLDVIIKWVKARPPKLIIADLGCGEAFLAQNVKNKVHSFDLVSVNDFVTVADISKVPLDSQSVDVVVFCLALMGTNLTDFLLEANRILKDKGTVKIAEIASRFKSTKKFVLEMKKLGFEMIKQDLSHSHFYLFDFRKTKDISRNQLKKLDMRIQLLPCLYKKR